MTVTNAQFIHPKSCSFIGSGMKYLMFPLHLLHLCLFGTSSAPSEPEQHATHLQGNKTKNEDAPQPREKPRERGPETRPVDLSVKSDKKDRKGSKKDECEDKVLKKKYRHQSVDRCESPCAKSSPLKPETKTREIRRNDDRKRIPVSNDEDSTDELATAAEDSKNSLDHWCSANTTVNMDMSVEYHNSFEKFPSFEMAEPMDISVEEPIDNSLPSNRDSQDDNQPKEDCANVSESLRMRGLPDGEETCPRSVDEEIATIFKKQATSSENESLVRPMSCPKQQSDKENKRPYRAKHGDSDAHSCTKKGRGYNNNERKTKTPIVEFAVNKRRKTARETDASHKKTERRPEGGIIEERCVTREDTPSKRRSRSPETPIKAKETERREVKYKETGTQTDSPFSDEDVEMTPVETKLSERFLRSRPNCRSNYGFFKDMDRDQNYVADSEDSSEAYVNPVRQRISSDSGFSSSTDLGFDERIYCTSDSEGRLRMDSPETVAIVNRTQVTRAPPGFPELPQNPPLTSSVWHAANSFPAQSMIPTSKLLESAPPYACNVPPAPTPMRHLYYNYPEFMDLPEGVADSKILQSILRNNYYRCQKYY